MTTPVNPYAQQPQAAAYTQDPAQAQSVAYVPVYPQGYAAQQIQPEPAVSSVFSLNPTSAEFWKGAAIGAGVTFLVTNESVQKAVVKTFSRVMAGASAGIEEMKEKYEDAKAEVEMEAAGKK